MTKKIKNPTIAIIIGLLLIMLSKVNIKIKFPKTANANEIRYSHYDDRPYPGVRNFDEWMDAWKKDVKNLLEQQRIEWEKEFGEN